MNKIRVLEIIDKPFLGGGQRHVLSLAAGLNRNTFDAAVCSAGGGPLVTELRRINIPHFAVNISKKLSSRIQREVVRIIRENRFDIVHTHGGVAGFSGRLAARAAGVPVIVHTLHGIHYLHYRNPFARRAFILLEQWCSRFTQGLILVSDADFDQAVRHRLCPPSKIKVIKNGIDPSLIKQNRLSTVAAADKKALLGIHLNHPILGTVARLHRQKGIPYLIQAMARIVGNHPGTVLVVVGGGPLESQIQKQVRELGLDKNVLLLGEREDALEILSTLDLFILPSLWEGLPYVLMEAGILRKPVVATSIPGVTEMIRDGQTGLLVPPANPDSLADAALRLIDDGILAAKVAKNLEKHITSVYAVSAMVAEIENFYLHLLSQNPEAHYSPD